MNEDPLDREIDFREGVRGKFSRPGLELQFPVYLDEPVLNALTEIANRKGMNIDDLVNDVLKKDLAIAESLR